MDKLVFDTWPVHHLPSCRILPIYRGACVQTICPSGTASSETGTSLSRKLTLTEKNILISDIFSYDYSRIPL